MKKQICQSCGIPIESISDYGTEKSGAHSIEYCCYCYDNGKFIQPNITMDKMIEEGKLVIENMDVNVYKKFVLKSLYLIRIKKLKRWK